MSNWVSYEAAARALGKSSRTVARMVADGRLKQGVRNGRAFVEIDATDPYEAVSATAEKMSEVGVASAVQTKQLADLVSDIRRDSQREIGIARQTTRVMAATTVIASVLFGGVAVYVGVAYYEARLGHVRHVVVLERERDSETRRAEVAEARVTEADRRTVEADQRAARAQESIDEINAALAGLADWQPWEQVAGR